MEDTQCMQFYKKSRPINMDYKIEKKDDHLIVEGLKDFNIEHIFECGQAFRWEKLADLDYVAIDGNRVAEFVQKGDTLYVYNSTEDEFIHFWHPYFDLDKDYSKIKDTLKKTQAYKQNESLKEAINFGYGIRVLNQNHFEMIVSFIISANNQIPRIKNSIRLIAQTYGEFICTYKGEDYYSFPSPKILAQVDPIELKEITRVGFRNERIVKAAKAYHERPEDFENCDLEDLKVNLLALDGVGPKVLDCILLFGYGLAETFPVDVWVKRLMEFLYIGETIPNKKILLYADQIFGPLKGYAQQYLFYYARENKIGK